MMLVCELVGNVLLNVTWAPANRMLPPSFLCGDDVFHVFNAKALTLTPSASAVVPTTVAPRSQARGVSMGAESFIRRAYEYELFGSLAMVMPTRELVRIFAESDGHLKIAPALPTTFDNILK